MFSQGWGFVQFFGVFYQVYLDFLIDKDQFGWVVFGGVIVNLLMLVFGVLIFMVVGYVDGVLVYVGGFGDYDIDVNGMLIMVDLVDYSGNDLFFGWNIGGGIIYLVNFNVILVLDVFYFDVDCVGIIQDLICYVVDVFVCWELV